MPDTLETALRELRETPTDEFAAELDARVAAGFGRRPAPRSAPTFADVHDRPSPPRPPRWRRRLLPAGGFAVAATLCVLLVVGLNQASVGGDSAGGGGGAATSSEEGVQDASSGASSGSAGGSTAAPAPRSLSAPSTAVPGRTRKVERTASVTLGVEPGEVETAATQVSDLTARYGGYVESSSVESRDEADFALRVPVARLDAAMAALARVGEVTERRQTTADITASFNRARADLQEARALRTSLLRRLGSADTDAETASLRARLRDANARIGAGQVALRQVQRRATYARVDVTVAAQSGGAATDEDAGWGVGAAWGDALRVLEVAAGVLVIVAAVLIPLALLGLLGLGGRRAAVARARRRVLDSV